MGVWGYGRSPNVRIPHRSNVSNNSGDGPSSDTGSGARNFASSPTGITLFVRNPRAAHTAASACAATAIRHPAGALCPTAAATSCGSPISRSKPEASSVTVSGPVCSTIGENANAAALRSPLP